MSVSHLIHIYAHRGANRLFPENTLAAFAHALTQQATHLEMDVHCTRDGHVVVNHDSDGIRVAGISQLVCESTLKQVQAWDLCAAFQPAKPIPKKLMSKCYVPTFEEILDAFPKVPMNVDIKDPRPGFTEKVVSLLHNRQDAHRVLLTSFHTKILQRARQARYQGQLGNSFLWALPFVCYPPLFWRMAIMNNPSHSIQVPPIAYKVVPLDSRYFIDRCHSVGKRVDYWTINDPEQALSLLHAGADGIMSDDVDTVRDAIFDFAKKNGRQIAPTYT